MLAWERGKEGEKAGIQTHFIGANTKGGNFNKCQMVQVNQSHGEPSMSNCLLWQGAFAFQLRVSQAPSSFPWLSSSPLLILWTPPPTPFDVFPGLPCPAAARASGCPSDADVWKSEGVPCVCGDPASSQHHELSLSSSRPVECGSCTCSRAENILLGEWDGTCTGWREEHSQHHP